MFPGFPAIFPEAWRTALKFNTTAVNYVQSFSDKEQMELMAFGCRDQNLITSTGFEPDKNQAMPDYELAKSAEEGGAIWTGTLDSGEKVMAVTQAMYSSSGIIWGLSGIGFPWNQRTGRSLCLWGLLLLVGCLVIFFVVLSNTYFIRSIVRPLGRSARWPAGSPRETFKVRIRKSNDDEIGDLCDTINYMAEELGASEKMKNDFISSVSLSCARR